MKGRYITIYTLCSLFCMHNLLYNAPFKFGLECVSPSLIAQYKLDQKRVGLVTNQTGVDHQGTPSAIVLRNKGVRITTLFVPEHGYTGLIPAGKTVENSIEPVTHLPIVSLYSQEKGLVGKTVNKDQIATIDVLIFDMQDAGMRHYTYISTLMKCLESCAEYNKLCIVLDRPNMLGGRMEGPLVEPDLISFISIAPIPVRHGLTIGELARFFNKHILQRPAPLVIVPMHNYTRTIHGTACFKKALSPNLTNPQACLGYSFLGLLGEVSPFNVGVGTRHAFRVIMVPTSVHVPTNTWSQLQNLLTAYTVGSVRLTTVDERTHKKVTGVQLQFGDLNMVKTFSLFLDIITLFRKAGVALVCAATFDKAAGTKALRQAIEQGAPLAPFKHAAQQNAQRFLQRIQSYLLYKPIPHID